MLRRTLPLLLALGVTAPQATFAQDGDRIVVRRPLGQETRGQLVIRDLTFDPNDPTTGLDLDEGLSVEVTVDGDPNAQVAWTTPPVAGFGAPEGPAHARVDRYAGRITFDGPIEEDLDGDGVADGFIAATWPVEVGFVTADGSPIGAPFAVTLGLTDEVPDDTLSQLFSPPEDPTRLDSLVARVGLLGAGGDKARLVAQVSEDSPADIAYVSFSFGTPDGGPNPLPPVMYLPLKASTVRIGADPTVWSSLSTLSATSQGEVPVEWTLSDPFGGFVSGSDSMLVDTRDLVLKRLTSVQEEDQPGRVTTRIAAADPMDLEGGQHLLLSRPADGSPCPDGTVLLQGRCYFDPGTRLESNEACPDGYHRCSCGQCVQNPYPPPRRRHGGFVVIIDAPPPPTTFPAVLSAEVRDGNGALLRVGTCEVGKDSAPCALDYGDGAETTDSLRAPNGWLAGANFVTDADGSEDEVVSLSLVPQNPEAPVVSYALDREFYSATERVKLDTSTATLGGEWTYEVEVLDSTSEFPIATALEGPQNGHVLIQGVIFEVE